MDKKAKLGYDEFCLKPEAQTSAAMVQIHPGPSGD